MRGESAARAFAAANSDARTDGKRPVRVVVATPRARERGDRLFVCKCVCACVWLRARVCVCVPCVCVRARVRGCFKSKRQEQSLAPAMRCCACVREL